jgi:DNA-binding transcriptional LysR family regulator
MDRGELANLTAFVAVADQRSFRAAAAQLGVTPSALSHSMRQLEARLGVRLLHRTTRSVSATVAGMRLLERLRPAIDQIAGALEDLNQERQRPLGRLRIYAMHFAAAAVVAPVWGRFLSTYPEIHLELAVGEGPIDIVAKGFDAGIGPQNRAPTDMIAVRVMGPMKVAVVGAPSYFARRRPPRTPDDLVRHSCVQYRQLADGDVLVWPFERNRKSRRISVDGRVMVNNPDLAVRGGRWAGDRVHHQSLRGTVPALGTVGPCAGRLVAIGRGTVPLLSWAPAGPRRSTRAHRHDPHVKLEAGQRFARDPVRGPLGPAVAVTQLSRLRRLDQRIAGVIRSSR